MTATPGLPDQFHRPPPTWRRLPQYSAGVRLRLVWGGLLALLGTTVGLTQPLFARLILTSITDRRPVGTPLALLGTAVLLGALLLGAGYYLLESAGETVVRGLRVRLVSKILRLRVGVTDEIPPGDLISRLAADTTLLRQITTQGLVSATTGAISLLGTLVLMAWLDWMLLLVTLCSVVVSLVVIRWSAVQIGRATGASQVAVAGIAVLLDKGLGAFRTVKAAGAEPREIERLTEAVQSAWRLGLRLARWQAVSGTAAVLSLQISFLAVLGVGGARVAAGTTPVSTLIAFMLFMLYLSQPITALSTAYGQYQSGGAAAVRIEQVLTLPTEPTGDLTDPGAPTEPRAPGRTDQGEDLATVDFEDVVFSYSRSAPSVHRGLTFSVPPGGMTAIVGPSGAGKSTLFALVERFYDVDSGRVLVNGRDVRDWPLGALRASIGYVEQDAPALAGTLRDNLTLGLGPLPDEQLHTVLRMVKLEDFVAALPGGLDGEIGYRGGTLSGGERQRIAIARALLRAPRLLLLDEVTSQLDAANERALRESIAAAAATTTVMVVAHRLSTVADARQIVVVAAGRVRAIGTHTELLKCDALYHELATTQLLTTQTPPDESNDRERTTLHARG